MDYIGKLSLGVSLVVFSTLTAQSVLAFPYREPNNAPPAPMPTTAPPRNCDIPPPNSTPPTPEFKDALKCLRTLGLDVGDRLSCTDDDIQRPSTCPPEPGSPNQDPHGYTNCTYQPVISKETAAFYQEMMQDLDIEVDAETASMVAAAQKPGAGWVECNNGTDIIENVIHEACHLTKQCDNGKDIDEVEAAECVDKQKDKIFRDKRLTTCRRLLKGALQNTTPSSAEE